MTIQCVFASLSGPANRLTEGTDFGKKKIIFSEEVHFVLGGYVNKQNCRILFTKIEEKDVGNIWLQQDGGMCHTAETRCFATYF